MTADLRRAPSGPPPERIGLFARTQLGWVLSAVATVVWLVLVRATGQLSLSAARRSCCRHHLTGGGLVAVVRHH
jgi:hypothetical protein